MVRDGHPIIVAGHHDSHNMRRDDRTRYLLRSCSFSGPCWSNEKDVFDVIKCGYYVHAQWKSEVN